MEIVEYINIILLFDKPNAFKVPKLFLFLEICDNIRLVIYNTNDKILNAINATEIKLASCLNKWKFF